MKKKHTSRFAFPSLLQLTHQVVSEALNGLTPPFCIAPSGTEKSSPLLFIDATCGNGYDTLFLCNALHNLRFEKKTPIEILSFDIQESALLTAAQRLSCSCSAEACTYVSFIHKGHEHISHYVEKSAGIAVAMYNLGFLPGGDKSIITQGITTLHSLREVAKSLIPQGLLCIHTYGGHEGGKEEMKLVHQWVTSLPETEWTVTKYTVCNKRQNPEALYFAQKCGLAKIK